MSRIQATFTGSVVAEPEHRQAGTHTVLEFPIYVNHAKKNSETGEYVKTGDVSKIRVTLWGDKVETDVQKGDLVEFVGTIIEKEFPKKDGTTGRQLQSDYVESVRVVSRRNNADANLAAVGAFPIDEDAPF